MAFKGTKRRTAKQIAEEVDEIGGHMNAFTSKEKTVYYIKVIKKDLEIALDILSDILLNSTFDKEELEKERGVILQELAMTQDTPDDIVFDYYYEQAYPDQPLGRAILGPAENIKSFTSEDLSKFVNENYTSDRLVLSIAGNIDGYNIEELAEKYCKDFKKFDRKKPDSGIYKGGEFKKDNQELSQVQYLLGFRASSFHDDDFYKMKVMSNILGSGMSSRLFQEIREKRGLVYTISTFCSSHSDTGLFSIYAGTSPESLEELTYSICDELKNAANSINDSELKKTIKQFEAGILMSKESTTSRSHAQIGDYLNYGKIIKTEDIINKIKSYTVDDIRDYIKNLINKKDITVTTYGKVKNMPSIEDIKNRLS
jgi:predicted Zn-dependent peptidase